MTRRKIPHKKPVKRLRRDKGLVEQYREAFPASSMPDYSEPDYGSAAQYVISENYTTYGAGEVPIPTPFGMRRA